MNGWILASAPDESSPINQCWNGREWIDIADINNAILFTLTEGAKIENMRSSKGDFQQQYTDRDIRIAEVSITVTLLQ